MEEVQATVDYEIVTTADELTQHYPDYMIASGWEFLNSLSDGKEVHSAVVYKEHQSAFEALLDQDSTVVSYNPIEL